MYCCSVLIIKHKCGKSTYRSLHELGQHSTVKRWLKNDLVIFNYCLLYTYVVCALLIVGQLELILTLNDIEKYSGQHTSSQNVINDDVTKMMPGMNTVVK